MGVDGRRLWESLRKRVCGDEEIHVIPVDIRLCDLDVSNAVQLLRSFRRVDGSNGNIDSLRFQPLGSTPSVSTYGVSFPP